MDITVFTELEFFFRILIAGICGGLIGYERNNRLKEAGIRTHLIVALAAALIMVVSKYGFSDVTTLKGVALDPSRIAAQSVTGAGFLGAGRIFVRNQTISGLACGKPIRGNVAFLGGPLHFLSELREAFIRTLNLKGDAIIAPDHSHLFAAVGAAMNAKEHAEIFSLDKLIADLSGGIKM